MADVRLTGDGSYTLYDSTSGECYHSYKGALTESEYVFVTSSRLHERLLDAKANNRPLKIIEMGLGTGLNYLLSARAAHKAEVELQYHALENNLLTEASLDNLKFEEIPGLATISQNYLQLPFHSQQPSVGVHRFKTSVGDLFIHIGDAQQCVLPADHFDLCFYDAFSPKIAPDLWHQIQLTKFYDCLAPGGSWVSYCASGAVRRDLQSCGFLIDRLPGPPGKREMLRANKPLVS